MENKLYCLGFGTKASLSFFTRRKIGVLMRSNLSQILKQYLKKGIRKIGFKLGSKSKSVSFCGIRWDTSQFGNWLAAWG